MHGDAAIAEVVFMFLFRGTRAAMWRALVGATGSIGKGGRWMRGVELGKGEEEEWMRALWRL